MERREFTALLAGAAAAWSFAARGQQGVQMRRIGVLLPYIEGDSQAQARVTAFRTALEERGWAHGQNVAFDFPTARSTAYPCCRSRSYECACHFDGRNRGH